MTSSCQDERDPSLGKAIGDWPDMLAILEVNIENGQIEPAFIDPRLGIRNAIDGADDAVAKRIQKILQHHGDERLVFDDENGTRSHRPALNRFGPVSKQLFVCGRIAVQARQAPISFGEVLSRAPSFRRRRKSRFFDSAEKSVGPSLSRG